MWVVVSFNNPLELAEITSLELLLILDRRPRNWKLVGS